MDNTRHAQEWSQRKTPARRIPHRCWWQ